MCDLETSRMGAPYIYDISRLRVKHCIPFIFKNSMIFPFVFLHVRTVYLDIIKVFIYSPTDAPVSCLKKKNNIKIYIKIYVETAPTYFGAVTPSSGST